MFLNFLFFKTHIPWRLFLKDPFIWISGVIGTALNASAWILLLVKMPRVEIVPLHYNIYFGFDRFGAWYMALAIPLIGSIIFAIHLFLAHAFYKQELFIARSLMIAAATLESLLFTAGIIVLLLNL